MLIDNKLFEELLLKAATNERKRVAYDLRNSSEDGSQRVLNAILPESVVPVHRHRTSSESVVCLKGAVTEIFYDEVTADGTNALKESARYELSPGMMCQIPKGVWHTLVAKVPSVIFEAKDGRFVPTSPEDIWSSN